MPSVRVLYADLSSWEGPGSAYASSPDRGVLRVSVEHPRPGDWLHFSGWDHYALEDEPDVLRVGVSKTDDPTDPYYRQGMVWTLWADGRQARTPYLPLEDLPRWASSRRGQWVDEQTARAAGLL